MDNHMFIAERLVVEVNVWNCNRAFEPPAHVTAMLFDFFLVWVEGKI